MEHSEKEKYLTLLQESLAEVEGYLKSSEDAAAAVAPDKGLGRLSRMEAMQDQQLVMEMNGEQLYLLIKIVYLLMELMFYNNFNTLNNSYQIN